VYSYLQDTALWSPGRVGLHHLFVTEALAGTICTPSQHLSNFDEMNI
jgi:hypothetical protein